MAKQNPGAAPDTPGSLRARLRLVAVMVLILIATLYLLSGIRLYFAPPIDALVAAVAGVGAAVVGILYGAAAWWVVSRRRWGHLLACAVTFVGGLLTFTLDGEWLDWTVFAANLLAFGLLLATIPRRR